ncbi:hypothetical protein HDU93_000827 [Gonapodya sp. JEL0774]|nr:hypothetical protein HDU93_000827 [Gonapodya sp. JEL0774]
MAPISHTLQSWKRQKTDASRPYQLRPENVGPSVVAKPGGVLAKAQSHTGNARLSRQKIRLDANTKATERAGHKGLNKKRAFDDIGDKDGEEISQSEEGQDEDEDNSSAGSGEDDNLSDDSDIDAFDNEDRSDEDVREFYPDSDEDQAAAHRGAGSGEEEEEEDNGEDEEILKRELSTVPFGTLVKLQGKLAVARLKSSAESNIRTPGNITMSSKGYHENRRKEHTEGVGKRLDKTKSKATGKSEITEKRSKSRPVEMSSKRPVSRYRPAIAVVAPKPLDPRFNPHSGKLNVDLVRKSYAFVEEARKREMEELKAIAKKAKDPEEKERYRQALSSMESRARSLADQRRREEIKREWRKKQEDNVRKGGTPYFLKKSDLKRMEAVEKFKTLTNGGRVVPSVRAGSRASTSAEAAQDSKKLEKFIEKRRKKNAAKERAHLPWRKVERREREEKE